MSDIYLTPGPSNDAVVQLSRTLFRKQILPLGAINYKGADGKARRIDFDKKYLTDLAEAFRAQAYDQVSTMLADTQNRHTMDPRQFGGEVVDVEVTDKGLYGVVRLTEDAARIVHNSGGKVGVSARIVEGVEKNDGQSTKTFPRALQHVLITTDPKISGMEAWSEVSLSGYDGDANVTDLTSASYEGDGGMPDKKTPLDVRTATAEQLDALTMAELEQLSEDDVDYLLTQRFGAGTEDEELVEDQPLVGAAQLSNEQLAAIELANANAVELANLRASLAADRFELEAAELKRQGVPAHLLELAKPLLASPVGAVVDLSNGLDDGSKTVDAADVVRQVLKASAGYIELARERGYTMDGTEDLSKEQTAEERLSGLLDAWNQGRY